MSPAPEDDRERRARRRELALQLTAIGFEFSGSVLGGLLLGAALDRWLGTDPWLLLVGTFGGLGAAVLRMIQILRRFDALRAKRSEKGPETSGPAPPSGRDPHR